MSEPRYSLIYNDKKGNWWLEICPEPYQWDEDKQDFIEDDSLRYSTNKDVYGSFKTKKKAIKYLSNFQNTGEETPILESSFIDEPCLYYDVNDKEMPKYNY
tara:strand:+ start:660 stop:962 length:303 start_codon:yes stop_codon:yes gene_type:complete